MKYLDVVAAGIKETIAYRTEFFAGLLGAFINLGVLWFAWNAVFAASKLEVIGGFSLSTMITYLVISSCLRPLTYSDIEYEMEEDVRSGAISTILTKPVSYPLFRISKGFSNTIFHLITNVLPIFMVSILLIKISMPVDVLFFLISVFLGYIVNYLLAFLTGMWAFWSIGSIWGIKLSKQMISDVMSGAIIPIYLFPVWFQGIAQLLPFQAVFNIPISIYIGKITGIGIFYSLIQQFAWIFILAFLSYLAWKFAERRVVVHGG